jgi:hypothetical protein
MGSAAGWQGQQGGGAQLLGAPGQGWGSLTPAVDRSWMPNQRNDVPGGTTPYQPAAPPLPGQGLGHPVQYGMWNSQNQLPGQGLGHPVQYGMWNPQDQGRLGMQPMRFQYEQNQYGSPYGGGGQMGGTPK